MSETSGQKMSYDVDETTNPYLIVNPGDRLFAKCKGTAVIETFTVLRVAGRGYSSVVLIVWSHMEKKLFALKVFRQKHWAELVDEENWIFDQIEGTREKLTLEPTGKRYVVKRFNAGELWTEANDTVKWRFLKMEALGQTLTEYLAESDELLDIGLVQKLSRHLILGNYFIHSIVEQQFIHADLKPDNILLEMTRSDFWRLREYIREEDAIELLATDDDFRRFMDEKCEMRVDEIVLKIADLGNYITMKKRRKYNCVIQTQPYRCIESFTGSVPYGKAADIWSLGCTIFEMAVKNMLFDYRKYRDFGEPIMAESDHLAHMLALHRMRQCPVKFRPGVRFSHYFYPDGYLRNEPDVFPKIWSIQEKLSECGFDERLSSIFGKFLSRMLQFDPDHRSNETALLNDDFFKTYFPHEVRRVRAAVDVAADTVPEDYQKIGMFKTWRDFDRAILRNSFWKNNKPNTYWTCQFARKVNFHPCKAKLLVKLKDDYYHVYTNGIHEHIMINPEEP